MGAAFAGSPAPDTASTLVLPATLPATMTVSAAVSVTLFPTPVLPPLLVKRER